MRVRHLRISGFRGIQELDWMPDASFLCLIGPGDSGKSTVLEALELVLSPRWNPSFDDADFSNGDSTKVIEITATLGGVPDELLLEGKFGLEARGWDATQKKIHDEPQEGDELVLSIRLRVDTSLEPVWTVVNDRHPEGKPISTKDRERLGVAQLGSYVDRHLTWGKGTVLSRFTGKTGDMSAILADVSRTARKALEGTSLASLDEAANRAQNIVKGVGVVPARGYHAQLDVQAVTIGQGGFSLHDGDVPVRRAGLGTRRLLSLALQRELVKQGGIALIDEIEFGLEPHRIRRLLRVLRQDGDVTEGKSSEPFGQVLMTTHSPVVIQEIQASELRIVRQTGGKVEVIVVPQDLQDVVRREPEAFLGARVLVCEGKTEVGFCRALDTLWCRDGGRTPLASHGIVPVNGNGSQAPQTTLAFHRLGYEVVYWGDSDVQVSPTPDELVKHGVTTVVWADNLATEERIAQDLPWEGVVEMLQLAVGEHGEESILASVKNQLSGTDFSGQISADPNSWEDSPALRATIGKTAKSKGWFKRIGLGERLGDLIVEYLNRIPKTDLAQKLIDLRKWVHGS